MLCCVVNAHHLIWVSGVNERSGYHALNSALEERKQFLLQIGLARHKAFNLAKALDFDVNYFVEIRQNWLENGLDEKQVHKQLLYEISSHYIVDNIYGADHQDRFFGKAIIDDLKRCNSVSNEEDYQKTSLDYDVAPAKPSEKRGYNLKSSQSSRSSSPLQGFNSLDHKIEFTRDDDNLRSSHASRSRSPGRDLNASQQENNYTASVVDHHDHLFEKSKEINQHRSKKRSNDGQTSSQISSYQQDHPIPDSCLREMQQDVTCKRDRSKVAIYYRSSQSSTSRSPPNGFRALPSEKTITSNVADFQLSRMRLNLIHCNNRPSSRNETNFLEPSNRMASKPTTKSSSSYDRNKEYGNVQQTQLDVAYQITNPNVVPLMRDYTTLYKRRQDIIDQDFENPMQWTGNSTQMTSLKSYNNFLSHDNKFEDYWIGPDNSTNTPPHLKDCNLTSSYNNQTQDYGNNSNILPLVEDTKPSLLSSPFNRPPILIWPQQPSTSEIMRNSPVEPGRPPTSQEQRKLDDRKTFEEQQKLSKQLRKEKKTERKQQRFLDPYKKLISNCALIQCGFQKPPPGLSKAKPQEYWSQWWPHYKYLEKTLEKVNFLLKPDDVTLPPRKDLLLRIGINKILRNVDVSEEDYFHRYTFKLFKYKKQLENPNFQNSLEWSELKRVQAALAQLENKYTLALLHQSLIYKCHFYLDLIKRAQAGEIIKSGNAINILTEKFFVYFVMESIHKLKAMCKEEWPQFEKFYNSIDVRNDETDISNLLSNNNAEAFGENNVEQEDVDAKDKEQEEKLN